MKKMTIAFLLNFIFLGLCAAQENQTMNSFNQKDSMRTALDNFNAKIDSLFKIGQYKEIVTEINACNLKKQRYSWQDELYPQLLASYAMLGDTASSNRILRSVIFDYENNSVLFILFH